MSESEEDVEFLWFSEVGDEAVGCDKGDDGGGDSGDVEGDGGLGGDEFEGEEGEGCGDDCVEDWFCEFCGCFECGDVGVFECGVDEEECPEDVEDGACDGGGVCFCVFDFDKSCGVEDCEDEDGEADGGDDVEDEEFVEAALGECRGDFDGRAQGKLPDHVAGMTVQSVENAAPGSEVNLVIQNHRRGDYR